MLGQCNYKATSVRRNFQRRRFFAGLARSSMARQRRKLLSTIEVAYNFYWRASRRAADRGKSSTSRRRTRLGCQCGLSSSHQRKQRMSSVATFRVISTCWRSHPIIIYIYVHDPGIQRVKYGPSHVFTDQTVTRTMTGAVELFSF